MGRARGIRVLSLSRARRCPHPFIRRGRRLALVADRAVFCFVIFHRHFEHVVASNTHAMDFRGRLFARLGLGGMRGVLAMLWLALGRILHSRESRWPPPTSE